MLPPRSQTGGALRGEPPLSYNPRFETYSTVARKALALATITARELGHGSLGTAHLVLGMLRIPERSGRNRVAGRVLEAVGLDHDMFRDEFIHSSGQAQPLSDTYKHSFSPAFTAALANACCEADAAQLDYVGTHHLLLGVARSEPEPGSDTARRFQFPKRSAQPFNGGDVALSRLIGFSDLTTLRTLIESVDPESAYAYDYHRADPKLADAARQTDEYKASMARWNAANPPRR